MLYRNLINSRAQSGIIAGEKAASCHLQPISVVLNRTMRCLNTHKLLTNKAITIYKMQKILQLKDIYNVEVSKFMCKYTTSQLHATFNKKFKLITDLHSYSTRQVKTRQFALPKARSNTGAKMIQYSAIEIWSKIPPEIKNKTCLTLFLAEYKKYVLLCYQNHILCFYLMLHITQVEIDLITCRYYSGKCQIMKYLCYVLHRQDCIAFTNTGLIKPVYEVVGCLQNQCISVPTNLLTSSFPQSMTARLDLNLLKSRYTIAMLQWSAAYDTFPLWQSRIILNV